MGEDFEIIFLNLLFEISFFVETEKKAQSK